MATNSEKINKAVSDLIRRRLQKLVESVSVDPAEDEEGDEYLLVTVKLSTAEVDDEALEKLLEEIESKVASLDDRYPSVRFLDAA